MTNNGHGWDRWQPIWHWLFYLCLGVPTALVGLDIQRKVPTDIKLLTVSAAAALAGWYLYWVLLHPHWLRRVGPALTYVVVMAGGVGFLLTVSEPYLFLIYALYPQLFILLPRPWSYTVAAVVAVLLIAGRDLPAGETDPLIALISNLGMALVLGFFVDAITQQAQRRQAAEETAESVNGKLAEALSEKAGLLSDNAGLLAKANALNIEREAGGLAERQRVVEKAHDTIAQGLTAIVTQLEAVARTAEADPAEAERRFATARRIAQESLAEVRRAHPTLRPDVLDDAQLPSALIDLTERWAEESGVPATMATTGVVAVLHPDVEVTLLQAAQEGLANAAKHAKANKVSVTLSYLDDEVCLDVRDDGIGFVYYDLGDQDGYGLRVMRRRVAALGGDLTVETAPGQGAAVRVSVPLP